MTEGPGGPSPPELQPPHTRVLTAWHNIITTLFRTIPEGVRKSQQARSRMMRGK